MAPELRLSGLPVRRPVRPVGVQVPYTQQHPSGIRRLGAPTPGTVRRIAALTLAVFCHAGPSVAQHAGAAADRPVTVYSDVLSGRGEFATVILAAGIAYRVEVTPRSATVSIQPFELGRRQPVVTRTLEDPTTGAGGYVALVVPAESGEYRIDASSDEPVRIRIVRDPREQALLEGRATTVWHSLALGAHAVLLPGALPVSEADTLHDLTGWELCLGIAEGAIPFARRLSGCAFTYARMESAEGARLDFYGVAPRYRLARLKAFALDLVGNFAFADRIESAGLGVNLRRTAFGNVEFEVEWGLAWMRRDSYTTTGAGNGISEHPALTTVLPRLSGGARIHF
jgi:hypothetical protein